MSVNKFGFFILMFACNPAFGQGENVNPVEVIRKFSMSQNLEEKTNLAFTLGEHYWSVRNLPQAKKWYKQCLELNDVPTYSNDVVNTLHLLANVYLNEAIYDSALSFCNDGFMAIAVISNKVDLPNLYQTKGRIYMQLGDHQSALKFFTIADSLYDISPQKDMQANSPYIKIAIGQIFESQMQMARAKEYFDMAYESAKAYKSNYAEATSIQSIANWQCNMKLYRQAKETYSLLLRPQYYVASSYRTIYTYTGLGDVYLGLGQYDSALHYYKLGFHDSKLKGEVYQQDLFYRKLGDSYFKLNNIPLAKAYYDSSLWWGKRNNKLTSSISACQSMADIYKSENNFAKAFEYQVLKERLKDSSLSIKNLEITNHAYTLNNIKQKDFAINLLTATNANNTNTIRKSKTTTNLLYGFVGLMGLSFLFYSNRLSLKRKLDRQLAISQERERIIADLHDDVGATLSSIHIYSELAGNIIETQRTESKELMQKISEQGKALSGRMSDIIWSLKPMGEGKYSILSRLKNYSQELLAGQGINTLFNISDDLDNRIENPQVRKNILLVAKEAMNNIAKYSRATTATISLQQNDLTVTLSIEDNGVGFNTNVDTNGNGLHNIKQRSLQVKGNCHISSSAGQGTKVQCVFPIATISHTM